MNLGTVLHVLGRLCTVMAVILLAPLIVCAAEGTMDEAPAHAFLVAAGAAGALGVALRLSFFLDKDDFGFGEAFATVTASWLVFMGLGAMPFLVAGEIPSVLDACFETMSGFTTTGASILPDPGELSRPMLLWRAMTHWIGGLGIVALSVAILPALGAGGNFLFQAEMPGPESEKLMPRISTTAKLLWGIYVFLTGAQVLLLWWAGMAPFDAVCHAFATLATGGFSTHPRSLAGYGPAIQWIVIAFMFLAGINFVLLYGALLRGRVVRTLRNTEIRVYVLMILIASASIAGVLFVETGAPDGAEPLVRDAVFTTVALLTTTGFATADYDAWPLVLFPLLMLLMISGGCAGSTAGGAKVTRLILLFKTSVREIQRLLRPSAVFVVKVNDRRVSEELLAKVSGFVVVYLMTLLAGTALLVGTGMGGLSSFSATLACISNVGPGFDAVGPTMNYAELPALAKAGCIAFMLLGRLEFFCVLVLFLPLAWRR